MSNTAPDGWQVRSIGDLVTLQYGKSPKEVLAEDGQYPVIGTGGVMGYASSYLYDGCTTVIGRKGTINKPSYVEGKFWAIDTTYFGTGYKEAEPKWFYYSLNSFDLSKYNEASGVPSLGRDTVNAIPLLTPPLPEQQKIAAILSSVDDMIEKTRAQIDKLKDLKTGIMQELLTKGIGHTKFKDSPVGRIPSNWYCIKMNTIAKVNDGAHHTPTYTSCGIPFLRVTDLKSKQIFSGSIKYISREEHSELIKRCKPEKGDILYSKNGTIGIPRLIDWDEEFSIFVSLALIKITSDEVHPEYLALFMDSPIVREQIRARSKQGTVTNLHLEEIRDFDIPLPSMEEQQKITRALNSVIHRLDVAIEKYESNQKLKKALMQDLLTGKVRVNVDHKESAVA